MDPDLLARLRQSIVSSLGGGHDGIREDARATLERRFGRSLDELQRGTPQEQAAARLLDEDPGHITFVEQMSRLEPGDTLERRGRGVQQFGGGTGEVSTGEFSRLLGLPDTPPDSGRPDAISAAQPGHRSDARLGRPGPRGMRDPAQEAIAARVAAQRAPQDRANAQALLGRDEPVGLPQGPSVSIGEAQIEPSVQFLPAEDIQNVTQFPPITQESLQQMRPQVDMLPAENVQFGYPPIMPIVPSMPRIGDAISALASGGRTASRARNPEFATPGTAPQTYRIPEPVLQEIQAEEERVSAREEVLRRLATGELTLEELEAAMLRRKGQ